jgi:hypothetical protein
VLRHWWAARERTRFVTMSGVFRPPNRNRRVVGTLTRAMQLSPWILCRVHDFKSRPMKRGNGRLIRSR